MGPPSCAPGCDASCARIRRAPDGTSERACATTSSPASSSLAPSPLRSTSPGGSSTSPTRWIKPFVPTAYLPDTYLPFPIPGFGLVVGIAALTLIGALTANLLGRTLISFGEQMVGGMPIVRNVYRALKQIFESVVSATGPGQAFQKVGLIEFPSKGLWSIVFVTGETTGEVGAMMPGGEEDLLTVFMPTGIVPPTGFVCFLPRRNVVFLDMNIEDAAKVIISAGMVTPESQAKLRDLAEQARRKPKINTGPAA